MSHNASATATVATVVHASQLLDLAILHGLRSAFETPLVDEMTDFLRTLSTDEQLDMWCAVLLNGWPAKHPTHLAFEAWRSTMASERQAREALLTALDDAVPTPAQQRALDDDLQRLAAHYAEAMVWTKRLQGKRHPSVAAYLVRVGNVGVSRNDVDIGPMPELVRRSTPVSARS